MDAPEKFDHSNRQVEWTLWLGDSQRKLMSDKASAANGFWFELVIGEGDSDIVKVTMGTKGYAGLSF